MSKTSDPSPGAPDQPFAPTTLGRSLEERDGGWFRLMSVRHDANERLRPHAHRFPAITIVGHGSFGLEIGSGAVDCSRRGVFFKRGEHVHSNLVGPRGCRSLILELRSDSSRIEGNDLPLPNESFWTEATPVRRTAAAIVSEFQKTDHASGLALEGLTLELVAHLLRTPPDHCEKRRPAWLTTIESLLHDRLAETISVSDLAAAVDRHPAHVARTFRKHHGCSVGVYLRRARLEFAARCLLESQESIAETALAAGFYDQAHFARCFKAWIGLTPSQFRSTKGF